MNCINFGKKLKKIRKSLNLSQQELAGYLGVSQRSISHYENGESQPDLITVCRLAYAFNVTLENLVGYDQSKDEEGFDGLREATMEYIDRRKRLEDELRSKYDF